MFFKFMKNESVWKTEIENNFTSWLFQNIIKCKLDIWLDRGEIDFVVEFLTKSELDLQLKNDVLKKIEEALMNIFKEVKSRNEYLKKVDYKAIGVLFRFREDTSYIFSDGREYK